MKDKKFIKLTPFKMQVLQSFPFIDEDFDAITNYELLCKVVDYLNKTVENVDYLNDTVNDYIDKFNELKSYVDNYFDNLDVQEEINNKLDEMAESGQLTDIIAQYLGLAGMIVFDNVSSMKLAENLVNGSKVSTMGYYQVNDGGNALYKVRTITNEDIVDEKSIIALYDNTLVAELIVKDNITPEMVGAYGDGEHDDHDAIEYCLNNYGVVNLIQSKTYLTNSSITLKFKNIINGNNATIIGDGETNYPILYVNGTTSPAYRTKVCINDLYLRGNNVNDGILFNYSADFFIRHVNVYNVRYAFHFKNSLLYKFENCLVQGADIALYNDDTSYSVCNNVEFDKCSFVANRCVMDSTGFAFKNALFLNCEIEANNNTTGDAVIILPATQAGTGGSSLIFEGCWFEANVPRDILSATDQSTPISVTNCYITHPVNTAYSFAKGTNEAFTIILDRCQDRSQYISGNNSKTIESSSPYVAEMNCYSKYTTYNMGGATGYLNDFGMVNKETINEINLVQVGSTKTGQIKAASDWVNIYANDTNGVRLPDANYLHPLNIGGQAFLWTYSNHLYCKVGSAPSTYNDGTILL